MIHECVIIADHDGALVELCGITILERLLRSLQRCGISRAFILTGTPRINPESVTNSSWARPQLELTICPSSRPITAEQALAIWPQTTPLLPAFRADTVFDIRLLQFLLRQTSPAALFDSSVPAQIQPLVTPARHSVAGKISCGASLMRRDWAAVQLGPWENVVAAGVDRGAISILNVNDRPTYSAALRKNLRPYWFPAPSADQTKIAENVLLDSVQKGSQDLPALVHAPIERFLVSHLCQTGVRPDYLTISWAITALLATLFFAGGHLVRGLLCALVVGILDGLDGKQARIKVETTKRGKWEHHLDSFFEVAWPTALAYYFHTSGQLPNAYFYLFIFILVQALDGIAKGAIYYVAEQSKQPAGRFDRMVRFLGGRRNVYVWILAATMLLGVPAKSLVVMAWWEGCTALLDLPHAAWAIHWLRRNRRPATGSA
ncbi:MAG: 1L-myo-inositol 1-phosphate cytidylyltransferase [Verrucomicrobiota bacterium]|jgi:phosphatidylglycerophosphate synthase